MSPFNRGMGEAVLTTFLHLSDDKNNGGDGLPTEMAGWVKEKIEDFASKPFTNLELYNFLIEISQIPVVKVGDSFCIGHISSFMQATACMDRYYEKPGPDESKMLDRKMWEAKLKFKGAK